MDEHEKYLQFVKINGLYLGTIPVNYRDVDEIVNAAVEEIGLALEYASERKRKDPETATKAVRQNGTAIHFVHPSIITEDLVLIAVKTCGSVLCTNDIPWKYKINPEIILSAMIMITMLNLSLYFIQKLFNYIHGQGQRLVGVITVREIAK